MNTEKETFLSYLAQLHLKHKSAENASQYEYNPGKTENLQYYDGIYDSEKKIATVCIDVKGLRYENRSRNLESISVGDLLELRRDPSNQYNSNNFELFTCKGKSLGSLPAELCNNLAPLYDEDNAKIIEVKAHYIEQFSDRSRYVKQGVLFVKLIIKLDGVE